MANAATKAKMIVQVHMPAWLGAKTSAISKSVPESRAVELT